jgi:hypothetical protein
MLKVPVHGDDDVALHRVKPGLESRRLPEIPPQPDHAHAVVLFVDLIQYFRCLIAAPVIHKNKFVRLPEAI